MNDEEELQTTDEGDEKGTEDNSSDSLFERTDKAAARIEAGNKKTEELLNRQEELYARQKLGGKASAGQEAKKPKEETPKEYRERIQKEMAEGKTEFGD